MSKTFSLNKEDGIKLAVNMLKRMKEIYKDEKGYYFYGGTKGNEIECEHNLEVLGDNESRLRKTFKNHLNWSNMRKSQKPVSNHLRFIFCKINGTKSHIGTTIRIGNYTCKKYYIPLCVSNDLVN